MVSSYKVLTGAKHYEDDIFLGDCRIRKAFVLYRNKKSKARLKVCDLKSLKYEMAVSTRFRASVDFIFLCFLGLVDLLDDVTGFSIQERGGRAKI